MTQYFFVGFGKVSVYFSPNHFPQIKFYLLSYCSLYLYFLYGLLNPCLISLGGLT